MQITTHDEFYLNAEFSIPKAFRNFTSMVYGIKVGVQTISHFDTMQSLKTKSIEPHPSSKLS